MLDASVFTFVVVHMSCMLTILTNSLHPGLVCAQIVQTQRFSARTLRYYALHKINPLY